MTAAPSNYDFRIALAAYAPGVVMTRDIEAAMAAQYVANGNTPLTSGQVLAITGTPPTYPVGMKRLSDSNPCPRDGWAIDTEAAFT